MCHTLITAFRLYFYEIAFVLLSFEDKLLTCLDELLRMCSAQLQSNVILIG